MLVRRSSQAALTLRLTLLKRTARNRLTPDTACAPGHDSTRCRPAIPRSFSDMPCGRLLAILSTEQGRTHMQQLITFMAVVAGLVFSVAVALVVEELIFGQVFRLFFTPQLAKVKSQQR
jgi:hypothetical protein